MFYEISICFTQILSPCFVLEIVPFLRFLCFVSFCEAQVKYNTITTDRKRF
ncbi:hypothetical protein LEP1GSC020_0583 [Leptospira interrogans serovar Grippotyphosa str. 2006006986]|nr:hypothetical protein LEP1GSC009_2788 [Leptospira interrogans serovar Grippotyphosa str. Andaman]EKP86000.1 hypothetical protein LEP1GSC020_0583 [Leptospira interrogans serovar Grippotyphosa str. 2006006986]